MSEKYTKLAIVGNGFDLAHGYATQYADFVKSVNEQTFGEFIALINKYCKNTTIWSDFEEAISILTREMFQAYVGESKNRLSGDEYSSQCQQLNLTYGFIKNQLTEYLKNEIHSKPFKRLLSVASELNDNTIAINFNYTDTVNKYLQKVCHLHGSIAENSIVLGYDYREEGCLYGLQEKYWQKEIWRKKLALERFLRNNNKKLDDVIEDIDALLRFQVGGKGMEDGDIQNNPNGRLFREYFMSDKSILDMFGIIPADLTEIVSIGHGIKADMQLLQSILQLCKNLNKITIFTYEKEEHSEIDYKVNFYKKYCDNVFLKCY